MADRVTIREVIRYRARRRRFVPAAGGGTKEILRGRIDKPIELEPAKVEAAINAAVAEIFAKYPTRMKK